jgi:predicted RNase H-like HicB family nuclease
VKYQVVIHEEDGRFWADVPALPGCYSVGDTREELLANIKEAIACHLDPPTLAKPLTVTIQEVEVEL